MRPLLAWVLCVALAWVGVAGHAAAQPAAQPPDAAAVEEGRARFAKGVELFHEQNYEAALAEFRRSYEAAPAFPILYNIGQVQFELRDYAGALETFQQYLARGGDEIEADRRAEVEAEIAKLRGRVAWLDVTVNVEDAEILIDDVLVGMSPLAEPVAVSAGRRSVTASKEGRISATRRIEVAGGDRMRVELTLTEPAAPAPAPSPASVPAPQPQPSQPPPTPAPNVGLWVSVAATGLLAVGTGVVGGLTLAAKSDFDEQLETFPGDRDDIDEARAELQTLAVVTDVLAGATVVAAGFALYFAIAGSGDSSAAAGRCAPPALQVGVGPRGARLVGSF
ncbi:MAG: PEGA domain-containing protein [Deltaproteobacteria bacterium]|jgi:tetratricopeptide (TPR) repeat protein|nr:PEGA domain-containing protein [Deltaproteobacteria bacterium]MBW2530883.1 PEGA domain-containing protein [Deltaproteobacteria bacterium]